MHALAAHAETPSGRQQLERRLSRNALDPTERNVLEAALGGPDTGPDRCKTCGEWIPADGAHTCPASLPAVPITRYGEIDKRERVDQMVSDLNESIAKIVESGQLTAYLDAMASNGMHKWSMNNRMLALLQMAERGMWKPGGDVHLMGFQQWKEFDRSVRKGEKAIWILAPRTRKVVEEDETGEQTVRQVLSGFRAVPVYNITQTDGKPLPKPPVTPAPKAGSVSAGTLTGLKDRVAATGYTYEERIIPDCRPDTGEGTQGYTRPETSQIVVDSRLSPAHKASVIAHELGHVHCGHVSDWLEYQRHRGRMETEAEMTAYLVGRSRGMSRDTASAFSPGYIATWSHGDTRMVQAAMTRATAAYNKIMDGSWPETD